MSAPQQKKRGLMKHFNFGTDGAGPFADRPTERIESPIPRSLIQMHPLNRFPRIEGRGKFRNRDSKEVIAKSALDDYPTPQWVARALCEQLMGGRKNLKKYSCLEPACNRMYLADTLWEYFNNVHSSDIGAYGYGEVRDFLAGSYEPNEYDWVITNPPFNDLWLDFALESLRVARRGVALLGPLKYQSGLKRFKKLYQPHPLFTVAASVKRIPFSHGLAGARISQAEDFAWFVWSKVDDPAILDLKQFSYSKSLERASDGIFRP